MNRPIKWLLASVSVLGICVVANAQFVGGISSVFTNLVTFSGPVAITNTATPTQAAGTLGLAGTATKPTLGANSEGDMWLTATGGLSLIGQGSTDDFEVYNKSGTLALSVPTGTTKLTVAGGITGTTTNDSAAAGVVGEVMGIGIGGGSGTATFTAATPTVVTVSSWGGNGSPSSLCSPVANCVQPVCFTTSNTLPTGISACETTQYFIDPASYSGNTFKISTSVANALAGTYVAASDTGTGTHTGINTAYLVTTVPKAVGALNLTAGDWDCAGSILSVPGSGTTTTVLTGAITTSAAGTSAANVLSNAYVQNRVSLSANGEETINIGPARSSLSATTPYYINANSTFAVSTQRTQGALRCRRQR